MSSSTYRGDSNGVSQPKPGTAPNLGRLWYLRISCRASWESPTSRSSAAKAIWPLRTRRWRRKPKRAVDCNRSVGCSSCGSQQLWVAVIHPLGTSAESDRLDILLQGANMPANAEAVLVSKYADCHSTSLSESLEISPITIRKDLDELSAGHSKFHASTPARIGLSSSSLITKDFA